MLCHIAYITLHSFNFKHAKEIFVKNGKGKSDELMLFID